MYLVVSSAFIVLYLYLLLFLFHYDGFIININKHLLIFVHYISKNVMHKAHIIRRIYSRTFRNLLKYFKGPYSFFRNFQALKRQNLSCRTFKGPVGTLTWLTIHTYHVNLQNEITQHKQLSQTELHHLLPNTIHNAHITRRQIIQFGWQWSNVVSWQKKTCIEKTTVLPLLSNQISTLLLSCTTSNYALNYTLQITT